MAGLLVTLAGLACAATLPLGGCSAPDGEGATSTTSTAPDGGGGGSAGCEAYVDQAGVGAVAIRVHNQTGQTLYFQAGGCHGVEVYPFHLAPAAGDDGLGYGYSDVCFQSCGRFETTPYEYCDCMPGSLAVPAGQSTDLAWKGTAIRFGVAMPTTCALPHGGYSPSCGQVLAAAPGSYQVTVDAYASAGYGGPPASSGFSEGPTLGTPASSAPVTFTFPGTPVVDVVFGPDTFADAGGP
jgi:hypothetical protein